VADEVDGGTDNDGRSDHPGDVDSVEEDPDQASANTDPTHSLPSSHRRMMSGPALRRKTLSHQ
jgi:hypothetical protein